MLFMSRVIFVKIFQFSSWLFGHLGNRLDEKAKVNSKIYDVTDQ